MGDIVWHGHHESDCPLEELDGTIEERRQEIIAEKPPKEHELRLRLLRPASLKARQAWAAYRAALASAWEVYDAAVAPAKAAYDESVEAWATAYDEAVGAWAALGAYDAALALAQAARDAGMASARAAIDAVKVTALRPILALHAIECPDCPWDGHSIFGGTA